ncbi:MAG: DNA translocase FtsK 4TM domain-containing protein [Alphaproteobacteria bacterium]|nr:DNA translocase FtsK 4TM domain-containing protein [Alphaproteobacteria bacterium]MBF0250304.1 DNA translocase FtsK 4TM domain-containing protein [Alphaproteobacteria bacterium]
MAWLSEKLGTGPLLPAGVADFFARRMHEAAGGGLIVLSCLYGGALASYHASDPSLNSAADGHVANWLGAPGAATADVLLQGFGLAAGLPLLVMLAWGLVLMRKDAVRHVWLRGVLGLFAVLCAAVALGAVRPFAGWPLSAGLGGVAGDVLLHRAATGLSHLVQPYLGAAHRDVFVLGLALSAAALALTALVYALALPLSDWRRAGRAASRVNHRAGDLMLRALGRTRLPDWRRDDDDDFDDVELTQAGEAAVGPLKRRLRAKKTNNPKPKTKGLVETQASRVKPGRKAEAQRQRDLNFTDGVGRYQFPPLDILEEPDPAGAPGMSKEALEQNAMMLSGALEDFGVRGEIVKVRPGPVVTLYELEPAPGTRAARVIGLSDDIARSMSAISVRVATVPGRNVIGIELPNQEREMVRLRELIASQDFEKSKGALNLALGKDIGGKPVIVDLARMPHLLVSGTTGSGKSVGVNAMICSLLYHHSPETCRFIMIDPKMLELSVYDGIPHLLSPVVTDPGKAVVALKWAVREMEDRYRAMSQLGVRNITGYNQRIQEAAKRGEDLTRTVQTGFDENGKPVHEEQPLPMEPLPYIVVIVDEMADLMLVAGKDVEGAIQRLAQMARAAGIHLIMATQRPSVDVITGTIKANFPTRIAFQVTSKIDSRTILGEQGAEQLLGQGDMLYMAGGGRITRVHAPFVSDEEVEDVVLHLKTQGMPDYVEAVTEESDPVFGELSVAGGGGQDDALYDQAVAVVAREGKASTSFVQRHLQIGYNRAARIIERMEAEGVVSKPNRVGRREVLIGDVGA